MSVLNWLAVPVCELPGWIAVIKAENKLLQAELDKKRRRR